MMEKTNHDIRSMFMKEEKKSCQTTANKVSDNNSENKMSLFKLWEGRCFKPEGSAVLAKVLPGRGISRIERGGVDDGLTSKVVSGRGGGMPGTEQGGVVDGLGGKESMKTVRKDVQRDGGMQRCPEYVLRCPEYAVKDVSGSTESVSGSDDLCPGEGGDDEEGGAVDGEGKVEGGDD